MKVAEICINAKIWFLNLSNKKFSIVILTLIFIKNGIHPIGIEWINWLYSASSSFPQYSSYLSYSLLPMLEARIFNYPAPIIWWFINFVLTFSITCLFIKNLIKVHGINFKKIFIVLCSLPLFVSPYLYLGHYDLLTITAALIASQSKNKLIIFFASLISVLTNVEQSIVTTVCLLFLYIATKEKTHKIVLFFWFISSLSGYFLFSILIGDSFISKRTSVNFGAILAIQNSLGVLNLIFYSLFGVAWYWMAVSYQKVRKWALLISLVFIPFSLCVLTVDRTRVGVAVGALPLLLFFRYIFENTDLLQLHEKYYYCYFAIYLFIPQLFIDNGEILRLPYKEFFNYIF